MKFPDYRQRSDAANVPSCVIEVEYFDDGYSITHRTLTSSIAEIN